MKSGRMAARIAGVACLFALQGCSHGVETFVTLCNDGKFVEAKAGVRGYVDDRIFDKHILPFKIIPNSKLQEAIQAALPMAAEHAQSKQAKENALHAWDELQRCAQELALDLKLATFNTQHATDPVSGIVVFCTSGKEIVFIGSLDKIGAKLVRDPKNGNRNEANALLMTLKLIKEAVEQSAGGDVKPEPKH